MTAFALEAELARIHPELRAVFEDLHAHPEIAFAERRTTALLASAVERLGFSVSTSTEVTGFVASLAAGPGPVVALRADIDALPLTEETGLPYASASPAMHACGHDLHATALLGTARLLSENRALWSGTVVLIAQPAEEVGSGARAIIAEGLFTDHPVPEVILGQHVGGDDDHPFSTRIGPYEAGQINWEITLEGSGGHAAGPHKTANLVVAAASLVLRLSTLTSSRVPAGERAVLVPATIHGGTATNVLPSSVSVGVCARALSSETLDRLDESVRREAAAIALAEGLPDPAIRVFNDFPVNCNDERALSRARTAIDAVFGPGAVVEVDPILGSEDFGTFGTHFGVPSAYWHFAAGASPLLADASRAHGGHSPYFAPDPDRAIRVGTTALTAAALAWLGANG